MLSFREGRFVLAGCCVGEFGEKFRKAREKKEISLDDVSKVTKIGTRMLQAIEEEHFDQLPGGVFNKGFIRAFAKCVGLNEQEAIDDYLEFLQREQAEALALADPKLRASAEKLPVEKSHPSDKATGSETNKSTAGHAPAKTQDSKAENPAATKELSHLHLPRYEDIRPPRRMFERHASGISLRLVIATIVVLGLAAVLWERHTRREQAVSPVSAAAPVPISNTPPPATAGTTASNSGNAPQKSPSPDPGKGNNAASSSSVIPANSTAPEEPEVTTKGSLPAVPAGKGKAEAAPLTLVIRANENSWISVSADGQTVSTETLIAPASTSIRAHREIVAKIGNSAGVTFIWNGQQIQPGGDESEAKTFVFDASGMRAVPPPQAPAQN